MKLTCRHCTGKSEHVIRGVALCTPHFMEAIEHSADLTFDNKRLADLVDRGKQKEKDCERMRKTRAKYKAQHAMMGLMGGRYTHDTLKSREKVIKMEMAK